MFGSYIKNLNDMVFSTSDSPEEHPNGSSVLGRIGSWLWARSPISSTENAFSPTGPGDEPPDALTEDVFYPVSQPDGQPSGEETAEEEWEEASSSFHSGNWAADQNAGRLTHSPRELSGRSGERQAQTGKKLHVYLEETSVSESAGQEVVCKYSKSLQVRPKSRSSVSLDSEKGQKYSSALVGVNLSPQKGDGLDGGDEMGRRNARRRYRKNSQGDPAESSSVTQADKELTDKGKAKSPKSTAADSPAPKTAPAPDLSPALPEQQQQQSRSSGPGDLNSGQDKSSSACGEAAVQAAEAASMEADDSFYRVERKTETPESKRRSMKVSKSEIKLFTKNVPLPGRAEAGAGAGPGARSKTDFRLVVTREEPGGDEATAELKTKEATKPEDKAKPAPGRLADKISLFENRKIGGPQLLDTPRSADVSPIRKPTGRLKAEHALSEQRSRSDESLDRKRSSSTSPPRQRGMTIKERVKNFNDASLSAEPSGPKPTTSRIHHRVTATKSLELLDLPDQPETANDKAVSKARVSQLNGADAKASADNLKVETLELTKKEETNSGETQDANDSNKVPTRTGPRVKKRRSKETASPKTESTKQPLDSVDSKPIDQEGGANVATQVTDVVLKKSQQATSDSGNVQDALTKKDELERTAKIQSKNTKWEKSPKETKLDASTAKEDVMMSIRQKKAIVDVKNRNKTSSSSSVKPPKEDIRNKLDSSKGQDEVTSSSPQQSLDDKEGKTVGAPEVKNSSDLRIKKSQGKLAEKVRSSNDKNPVEASNSQCDSNNKEGNASPDTREEEAISTTDKIVQESKETSFRIESEVPTVKQEKSMQKEIAQGDNTQPADTTSTEKTGNEQNLPSVKQAAACAINKTEPHSAEQLTAEKIEGNMAQATQGESKQEAPSGELEKVAERRLRRPYDKLKGTAEGKDKGPSNEVQKSLSVSESKEVVTTSEQQQASDKLEGATKRRGEMTPNEAHKSVPSKEKKIDLASVKKDVAATSGQLKMNDKTDTRAEDKSTLEKQTKGIIVENNANSSNAKDESDTVSEVQKNIGRKDFVMPAKSAKTQGKATIQDSSLQLEKDEAKLDATEEKIAHSSVSKPETDPSNSSDETKAPIHKSPAILPQKDQEIASQNSAPFTRRTDGHVKDEKGRLASDLPATGRNANKSKAGLEAELLASKIQSKQDAEVAVTRGVIEKGGKLVKENVAGETETFGRQVLDNGKAKLGQETNLTSQDQKTFGKLEAEKNASQISPSNTSSAEESVGAENNAFSVNDNEGEREGHSRTIASPPFALTKSTKIHGKETEPKSAAAAELQAECVTVEKNSQNWPDESPEQSSSFTANQGALAVAKNDISEQKDVVKKASSPEESEKASSDLDNKVGASKMPSESPLLARDLIIQASGEFEKAITNITSGKTGPTNEQLANGGVTVLPKGAVLKDEAVTANKQSLKTLPQAKTFLDSSRKRHNLAKGRSKDDWSSARHQDAPSSWLDVDFPKQKLKVSNEGKLKSSGSESNLLDTSADLDDEDFVEKIKKLCAPFQLPPRKHNHLRPPQPPFAMPAIREDRFEKTFDPEEFTFGLRKKKFSLETPSLLAKLQSSEGKTSIKPARASLADRSMLLSGLDSRFRDKANGKEEQEDAKDEVKDEIKVKSRLEGSCVLSSLTTSSFRSKLSQSQAQAESTESGNVSPSNSPQQQSPQQPGPPPLSPTHTDPERSHRKEETPSAVELVVTDSDPPRPAFGRIKLPGFLEKYFPREEKAEAQEGPGGEQQVSSEAGSKMPSLKEEPQNKAEDTQEDNEAAVQQPLLKEPAQSPPGELQDERKVTVKMPTVVAPAVESSVRTEEPKLPESVTNHFSGISLKDKAAQPRRRPSKKIRPAKGFHKRPGKMLLFEKVPFEGQLYEVHRDMEDATSLLLSAFISVKVIRGCWVLYEKPGFQGRTIALEEGSLELTNVWAEPGPDPEAPSDTPMQIGSIRLAVADYSVPHIDLFTDPEGRGRVTAYHDDALETGSFGIPLNTASIQVHSGVWLVFSDPGFQGMLAVLETGGYPFPETWGFPSPFVGSLRPLKMGGFKVENPNEVKAVVYEKAGFEGPSLEVEADVFSFGEEEGDDADSTELQSVGSLKVHGGLWVGYSEPGFEGQQYILEEGEYPDCAGWGGAEILSIRPIMSDFMSPHMKMFSDRDFGKLGVNIDLTVPVINLDETGYGLKTQSMDVLSGVWVVFEEAGFCGESYVVEKGQYGSPEDWGATRPSIASAMPVLLENFENTAKFKVQLFSEADFKGSALILEDSEGSLPDGFTVASCKVLNGSWLAFEGQDFSGRMYVLDEGTYPDLRAMGCVHTDASVLSMQIVGFEFSVPSIVLFERSGLKGKRVVLSGGVVNLQMSGGGGRVQSVLVEGGMWVLYEEINFRGAQVLLRPGEVSDWRSFCHWRKIGSLRPLLQKQVHFHLRNRLSGQLLTLTGDLDDIKLLRVQEAEETHGFEQIWFFQSGQLRCKLLEECCLCPSSSVAIAGARVGVTPALDEDIHLWSITPEGFVCYSGAPGLVLDIKGGHNYDKSQVVLNTLDSKKLQQLWHIEVL